MARQSRTTPLSLLLLLSLTLPVFSFLPPSALPILTGASNPPISRPSKVLWSRRLRFEKSEIRMRGKCEPRARPAVTRLTRPISVQERGAGPVRRHNIGGELLERGQGGRAAGASSRGCSSASRTSGTCCLRLPTSASSTRCLFHAHPQILASQNRGLSARSRVKYFHRVANSGSAPVVGQFLTRGFCGRARLDSDL